MTKALTDTKGLGVHFPREWQKIALIKHKNGRKLALPSMAPSLLGKIIWQTHLPFKQYKRTAQKVAWEQRDVGAGY